MYKNKNRFKGFLIIIFLIVSNSAYAANYYANSFSRANCNAPLQLVGLASGNIFLSLITKFIPGTRFNESVSWDKYAIAKSSNNHRMQVISTQTLIVKKNSYVDEFRISKGWKYFNAYNGNSSAWSSVPDTWRSYAGYITPINSSAIYKSVNGVHDERLNNYSSRKTFSSASNCNLTQW